MDKLVLSDDEWKKRLTSEEYDVLRRQGTGSTHRWLVPPSPPGEAQRK